MRIKDFEHTTSRYPGYVPGSDFTASARTLAGLASTVIKAAPGLNLQWAVTSFKAFFTWNGLAAPTFQTIDLDNGILALWETEFGINNAVTSAGRSSDIVVFPSDDPILFGVNNPIRATTEAANAAGTAYDVRIKGYLVHVT